MDLISNFLLEKDTVSPAEIARRIAAAAPTNGIRQRTLARRELTEEEKTMEFLNEGLGLCEVNPLHAEFKAYTQVAKALSALWGSGKSMNSDFLSSLRLPVSYYVPVEPREM